MRSRLRFFSLLTALCLLCCSASATNNDVIIFKGLKSNIAATKLWFISNDSVVVISCVVTVKRPSSISSTLPACAMVYKNAVTGLWEQIKVTNPVTSNVLGATNTGSATMNVSGGSNLSFYTTEYASMRSVADTDAPLMLYSIALRKIAIFKLTRQGQSK